MSRPTADQIRDPFGFATARDFPEADAATMLELDFLMMEGFGIGLPAMKENAARAVAALAVRRYFGGCPRARTVVVLAGKGGNGDVALLAARRLADWGGTVSVALGTDTTELGTGAAREVAILERLGRSVAGPLPENPDLIIDGLIGYSLRGDPKGRIADLIRWANNTRVPVLSIDVPSGFDAQTGRARDPAIRADATLALGLPKLRLGAASHAHVVGDLYVGDVSIPPEAWSRLTIPMEVPSFGPEQVLRLSRSGEPT